ncbi:hypothetical protein VCUG_01965 [Vavraia culicis subsp. floridensis]|uniref:Uncharacterized protein n=1 Tax=Vavraia culicis (isolate floridensis) TaxID=948595 RepID=L2GT39_VAVCU|nr:uncharacterized protein VCUG_01965 [Vavraia culicis subsp. floridensis]ELA46532.1 hypothetical protein VCUG_01965 [Vavraia culicis subsp. floridensis]
MYKAAFRKFFWSVVIMLLLYALVYLIRTYYIIVQINQIILDKMDTGFDKFQSTWNSSPVSERKFIVVLYTDKKEKCIIFGTIDSAKWANHGGIIYNNYHTTMNSLLAYKEELAALYKLVPVWISKRFHTPWNEYVNTLDVICYYLKNLPEDNSVKHCNCIFGNHGKIVVTQILMRIAEGKNTCKTLMDHTIDFGNRVDDLADKALFYFFLQLFQRNFLVRVRPSTNE